MSERGPVLRVRRRLTVSLFYRVLMIATYNSNQEFAAVGSTHSPDEQTEATQ